jgi:leucyl aminopeptidase
MTIDFAAARQVPEDVEVLGVPVWGDLSTPPGAGPEPDRTFLRRVGFEGQPGQAVALPGKSGTTIVAVGVGDRGGVTGRVLREGGAALAREATGAANLATTVMAASPQVELAAALVEGIGLAAYRFAGQKRTPSTHELARAVIVGASDADVRRAAILVQATSRARDWVNQPSAYLTPTRLANLSKEVAADHGLHVRVWEEDQIRAERLGGLIGVAAGSSEPPRLIRLAHEPDGATRTVALVGKGVTFDSGGLSLKSARNMMTMKGDMGGAAAVIAAVTAIAELDLKVRVVGWIPATENLPGTLATHPGDVLVVRDGTSIEVLDTDYEGRLILADALSLAVEEAPDAVVDVATLTGAQRIALGTGVAAVLGNEDDLVERIISAGESVGEPTWRLPLVQSYRKRLDSDVADLKNVPTDSGAGAIMAALFLETFIGGTAWAHLDIAAPNWSESDEGWLTRGGTGWGTRTLVELIRTFE